MHRHTILPRESLRSQVNDQNHRSLMGDNDQIGKYFSTGYTIGASRSTCMILEFNTSALSVTVYLYCTMKVHFMKMYITDIFNTSQPVPSLSGVNGPLFIDLIYTCYQLFLLELFV